MPGLNPHERENVINAASKVISTKYLYPQLAEYGLKETQCGFKAYPRSILEKILHKVQDATFSFDTELFTHVLSIGGAIRETGIFWSDSAAEASGTSVKERWRMFKSWIDQYRRLCPVKTIDEDILEIIERYVDEAFALASQNKNTLDIAEKILSIAAELPPAPETLPTFETLKASSAGEQLVEANTLFREADPKLFNRGFDGLKGLYEKAKSIYEAILASGAPNAVKDDAKKNLKLVIHRLDRLQRWIKTRADRIYIYDKRGRKTSSTAHLSTVRKEGLPHANTFMLGITPNNKVLLQLRGENTYLFPATPTLTMTGLVDMSDVDSRTATLREIEEETSLKLDESRLTKVVLTPDIDYDHPGFFKMYEFVALTNDQHKELSALKQELEGIESEQEPNALNRVLFVQHPSYRQLFVYVLNEDSIPRLDHYAEMIERRAKLPHSDMVANVQVKSLYLCRFSAEEMEQIVPSKEEGIAGFKEVDFEELLIDFRAHPDKYTDVFIPTITDLRSAAQIRDFIAKASSAGSIKDNIDKLKVNKDSFEGVDNIAAIENMIYAPGADISAGDMRLVTETLKDIMRDEKADKFVRMMAVRALDLSFRAGIFNDNMSIVDTVLAAFTEVASSAEAKSITITSERLPDISREASRRVDNGLLPYTEGLNLANAADNAVEHQLIRGLLDYAPEGRINISRANQAIIIYSDALEANTEMQRFVSVFRKGGMRKIILVNKSGVDRQELFARLDVAGISRQNFDAIIDNMHDSEIIVDVVTNIFGRWARSGIKIDQVRLFVFEEEDLDAWRDNALDILAKILKDIVIITPEQWRTELYQEDIQRRTVMTQA